MTQAFMRTPRSVELALLATALFLTVPGCKDDDPSPTAPSSGVSNPGTNPVGGGSGNSGNSGNTGNTGTGGNTGNGGTVAAQSSERLAWNQTGDTSQLRFRAYIDSNPFDLPDATCNGATPSAECTSPLPALSTGTHSIQLTSVLAGTESDRSPSITYQKTAAAASYSALPLAWDQSAALRVERVITIADGLSFTADVVATGVRAPAQLAWLPDGRLLLSDADGRVRMVRPGEPEAWRAVARVLSRTGQSSIAFGWWQRVDKKHRLTIEDRRDFAGAALAAGELAVAGTQVNALLAQREDPAPVDILLAEQGGRDLRSARLARERTREHERRRDIHRGGDGHRPGRQHGDEELPLPRRHTEVPRADADDRRYR